jgi:hypothetical protein
MNTPPDETKLWRYLDLFHFLGLLSQQSLYFANLVEFSDDKWEGALPAGMEEALRFMYRDVTLMEEIDPEMLRVFKRSLISLHATYGVNCWHKNQVESVAMWKLYTHGMDGVAIQTTVGRLKTCLSPEPRPVYIAAVKYGHDEHKEDPLAHDALIPIVTNSLWNGLLRVFWSIGSQNSSFSQEPQSLRSSENIKLTWLHWSHMDSEVPPVSR